MPSTDLRPSTGVREHALRHASNMEADLGDADEPPAPDYRRLFEAAPGMVTVVDADLRIVAISDAVLRATHRRRDDVVGRGLFDAFPDDPQREPGQSSVSMRHALGRVLRDRASDSLAVQRRDVRRPEAEGGGFEERIWSTSFLPVLDADGARVEFIVIRTTDITEYVRAADADQLDATGDLRRRFEEMELDILERSHELQDARDQLETVSAERARLVLELQQLLDLAPEPTLTVNAAGLMIRVNEQLLQLLGYDRHELVGQPVEVLLPDALRAQHRGHRDRFMHAPYARPMGKGMSLVARRRDGSTVPVEVSLSPLELGDELLVTASLRDVSEARARERALLERVDRREHAARLRSAEYQRALHDYRQVMRHRIANPLQVISGTATTMIDHPDLDSPTRRTMLESILRAASDLQRSTLFDAVRASDVERDLDPQPRDGSGPSTAATGRGDR